MRRRFLNNTYKNISEYIDYSKEYFTIESLVDNNEIFMYLSDRVIQYSLDKNDWKTFDEVILNAGDVAFFKGDFLGTPSHPIGRMPLATLRAYGNVNVKGNIMSLVHGDDFENQYDLTKCSVSFEQLLWGCPVVNASDLVLPATTLVEGCYAYMFEDCKSLTTAPELPATILTGSCYCGMFQGCNSLTTVPELPATTLADSCYYAMFCFCSGLTVVPELPATTLASFCYYYMFNGCTSLTTAPALPATTLATGCYSYMFYGCSKLNEITMLATDISASRCLDYWVSGVAPTGTFIKHPDLTSLPSGGSGIPNGWTVVDNEKNLITFTIDGTEYQAEEGMTWADWYVSNYNSNVINEDMNPPKYLIYEKLDTCVMTSAGQISDEYGNGVYFGDVIIKNHTYKVPQMPMSL